ncbi:LuxR family transcriptional regulator [Rhodococcus sp. WMMA185]|uniref:ATP-binding protein n=1 Tax=Rhodococcus sp. WMMA185 TaxID=679318 RepID=UPI000878A0D8|nr:LuxR C-terminal-related transcriptional regulator [Rhodococcus sp. WMMA185]AOW92662.1 LuxR family transcriptional regulator [Rhodococcus sp. WMMA185]
MPPGSKGTVGNLPHELTSFVGRRRELTEARRLLSVSRLVTLSGIGGVGKTRLALRVAADSRRAFDDGAWIVGLGELDEGSRLVDAVSAALRLREQLTGNPEALLVEFLSSKRLLLVLDNCEHVVAAAAQLSETLLRRCPELRILTTSREPLGIGGEAVLRVPPLTVPEPERSSLQGLPQYEAVTLFMERAAAAVPEFELTEANHAAVARICRQLDGLPLAIELAAVRLRVMSVEQILQRLTDRYRLLTAGSRCAPSRQQTLRLSIDWSYDLCTEVERTLWAKLSVFAGGFELDAVEGICAGDVPVEEVLDVVASLIDKSILIREESGPTVRYRLLETVRQYGRERLLETGEIVALRRRHRDWYEALVLQSEAEWISPLQGMWIRRLDAEKLNVRAALHFCLTEPGELESGLRIGAALYPYWRSRGMLREGRRWLDQLLARHDGDPSQERIEAMYVNSVLTGMHGDVAAAQDLVAEGTKLAARNEDALMRALMMHAAGCCALFLGDFANARKHMDEALVVFRDKGSLLQLVWGLSGVALVSGMQGETSTAKRYGTELSDLTEAHGESVYRGWSLWVAGVSEWQRGQLELAEDYVKQGLRLSHLVDDRISACGALEVLAWIAVGRDRAEHAAELMGAAAAVAQAVGNPSTVYPNLLVHHAACEQSARDAIGDRSFDAAFQRGVSTSFGAAVACAFEEQPRETPSTPNSSTDLTRREWQVAELVADGLTNKAIAAKLVISQRTAQGHVEHILAKLGFNSRSQIAAWTVEHVKAQHP